MLWKQLHKLMQNVKPNRAAEVVLEALEIKSRPTDVFNLSNMLGAKVKFANMTEQGILHFIDDVPTIFVKYNEINVKQRFTIAHQLGHALLHFNYDANIYFKDLSYSVDNKMEQEANRFAANILMPESELINLIRLDYTKEKIANHFDVSLDVLNWQIFDIA